MLLCCYVVMLAVGCKPTVRCPTDAASGFWFEIQRMFRRSRGVVPLLPLLEPSAFKLREDLISQVITVIRVSITRKTPRKITRCGNQSKAVSGPS